MNYFVYILECGNGECGKPTYYTGYTNNIITRFLKHCSGTGAKYTKGRGPLNLVYVEEWPNKSSAMRREYEVKQLKKKQKEKLIYENTSFTDKQVYKLFLNR